MPFQRAVVVGLALHWPLLAEIARFGRGTGHAGGQHDPDFGALLADDLGQFEARPFVCLDIEERQINLHVQSKRLDGFVARAGLDDVVAALAQIARERRAHEDVSVNEQQSGRFRRS